MGNRLQRLLDARIDHELQRYACVSIMGPAGAGKCTSALRVARSVDVLYEGRGALAGAACSLDDGLDCAVRQGSEFVEGVRIDPSIALQGADPHAICDVHAVPAVGPAVEAYASALGEMSTRGALVTTGNCEPVFLKNGGRSAVGREDRDASAGIALHMLPLTLQESGVSDGSVSLSGLFEGELLESEFMADEPMRDVNRLLTSADVARVVCRGGWPAVVGREDAEALEYAGHHARMLVNAAAVRGRMSAPSLEGCAWALARRVGEIPTFADISSGMEAMADVRPARDTVRNYLRELVRQQVVLAVPGWTPPGRARRRVRAKAKYYFVDPSMPAALLGLDTTALVSRPVVLQALLGNLVARDLAVYLEATGGGRLYHYADDTPHAVDFVVVRGKGGAGASDGDGDRFVGDDLHWGAVRVVLSAATVDDAARDLQALAHKSAVPPAFMAVLVGCGTEAYQRDDGVWVVPVGCLGA